MRVFLFLPALAVLGVSVWLFFSPDGRDVSVSLELKDKTVRRPAVSAVQEAVEKTEPAQEKEVTPKEETELFAKVRMKKSDCAKLFISKMADSKEYLPEISTTGGLVAPADLPSSETDVVPAGLPEPQKNALSAIASDISFPVSLRLKKRYPYLESDIKTGDIPLVIVSVKNGEVFINGVSVDSDDLKTVRQACQNAR